MSSTAPESGPESAVGRAAALPDRLRGAHMALVGPTASGKSAVAMELARARIASGTPTEIVSCDSMQVYRGMDIGTAKATRCEQAEVRHHLIDLVEPSVDHNLPRFLEVARGVLQDLEERGVSALLVGGTGLYVRGLVDGFTPPPHFPEIAAELEATSDTSVLTARLARLDPVALSRIPPGNRRRIVRALEVSIGSGTPFSAHGEALDHYGPTPYFICGLRPERDALGGAIDGRYERQMRDGFLEEVRSLRRLDRPMSRTARQALGYRELLEHLEGGPPLEEALRRAKTRTRRFAVRQLRWFGRDPRIEWIRPPGPGRSVSDVALEVNRCWDKCRAGAAPGATSVDPAPLTGQRDRGHAASISRSEDT